MFSRKNDYVKHRLGPVTGTRRVNRNDAGGRSMSQRVRIVDIAEELGLSTATVSNVIHGKTKKISDETVKRVQELIEKRGYIPSMAGILLAQNSSGIIGAVVNDHRKYEGGLWRSLQGWRKTNLDM